MARLPDLVQDSKLETHFRDAEIAHNAKTIHIYDESDPSSRRRLITRSEHWERQREIGSGGFGRVWLEKCTEGGRDIEVRAVKQLQKGKRFRNLDYNRELEAIAKFSHWKYERCFVKSFGWYESPNYVYIAMEYLNLGDLDTYLDRNQPLPENEVKEVTSQVLDGLRFMHDNQFAHRDLKPNEWWVKIADFGISKRIEEDHQRSTTLKGTFGYMAPKLHGFTQQGSQYAVDIWAVGEIIFEMLTKQPTFKSLRSLHEYTSRRKTFPSDVLLAAKVSELGIQFILSHMEPDPEDRITVENALLHQWMVAQASPRRQLLVIYVPREEKHRPSTIDSMTEDAASWDTITPQPETAAPIARKAKILETLPRQTSGEATGKAQLPDCKLVMHHTLEGHSDRVNTVAFSPNSALVASAGTDNTVRLWDPVTGTQRQIYRHKTYERNSMYLYGVKQVKFSPNGELVASAGSDGTVRLWDPVRGKEHHRLRYQKPEGTFDRVLLHLIKHFHVFTVAFSPDGKMVASAGSDNTVRLWDPVTGVQRHILHHKQPEGEKPGVYTVVFSPDGKLLASASSDETVRLWDPVTGMERHRLYHKAPEGGFAGVFEVAFSPDGKLLASGGYEQIVRLWDPFTGMERNMLYPNTHMGHSFWAFTVVFSPDGKLLASAGNGIAVRLWDLATGVERHILYNRVSGGKFTAIFAVAFSPDGKLVASGGSDDAVRLWDPVTGVERHTFYHRASEGNHTGVKALAFSPDGKLLASTGTDNTVRLWDPMTGSDR